MFLTRAPETSTRPKGGNSCRPATASNLASPPPSAMPLHPALVGRATVAAASPARRQLARPRLPLPISLPNTIVLAAAFLPMALGHDHGESAISDGETVSKDPIVRLAAR